MTIRKARTADLDFFVDCVTHEGWLSETRAVFENFYAHDPDGCLVAEEDRTLIGMIVATAYDTCGFLGELIVVPERRGHGVGRSLMEHAIGYLGTRGCRSMYLDGDLPAVPLYERLGFHRVVRSLRFIGRLQGKTTTTVLPMTGDDLHMVLTLDRSAFGADRSFFLKRRLELFPHLCFVSCGGNSVSGFIMGQPGHGVVTVGPWHRADESTDPLDLLTTLARVCGEQKLRIGLLESNKSAVGIMRHLSGFAETEPCIRMVLGPDIGLGSGSQLLAVGSPAKG